VEAPVVSTLVLLLPMPVHRLTNTGVNAKNAIPNSVTMVLTFNSGLPLAAEFESNSASDSCDIVTPVLTAINVCGEIPSNVALKNVTNGIWNMGDEILTNQLGNMGVIRRNSIK